MFAAFATCRTCLLCRCRKTSNQDICAGESMNAPCNCSSNHSTLRTAGRRRALQLASCRRSQLSTPFHRNRPLLSTDPHHKSCVLHASNLHLYATAHVNNKPHMIMIPPTQTGMSTNVMYACYAYNQKHTTITS